MSSTSVAARRPVTVEKTIGGKTLSIETGRLAKQASGAVVVRVGDTNPLHLGHHATADGRWRIYVFADAALPGTGSAADKLAEWFAASPASPLAAPPPDADPDAWFDLKVIYQQPHTAVDIGAVPAVFKPQVGPFKLTDYEKVYATDPNADIFELRGIDRSGAVVVVRPDQYVANVLPLGAADELAEFFAPLLAAGPRAEV